MLKLPFCTGFYAPLKEQFERAAAEGFIAVRLSHPHPRLGLTDTYEKLRNLSFVKFVEGDDVGTSEDDAAASLFH